MQPFGRFYSGYTNTIPALGMHGASNAPLTETQLRRFVPSIFAEGAHESRSKRYTFIPTIEVVRALEGEGFAPVFACEAKSRNNERAGFTKHMIRFRQEGVRGVEGAIPELIMLNSHDGSSSYKFMAGAFRFVCANGLVCGNTFAMFTAHHKGDVVNDAIANAFEVAKLFPTVNANMAEMAEIKLSADDQLYYASAALLAKYNPNADPDLHRSIPIEPAQLLIGRRPEDSEYNNRSLLATYNVVQENLIRGGLSGVSVNTETGRRRRTTTRPIKGIDQNISLNQRLWDLATDMARQLGARPTPPAVSAH